MIKTELQFRWFLWAVHKIKTNLYSCMPITQALNNSNLFMLPSRVIFLLISKHPRKRRSPITWTFFDFPNVQIGLDLNEYICSNEYICCKVWSSAQLETLIDNQKTRLIEVGAQARRSNTDAAHGTNPSHEGHVAASLLLMCYDCNMALLNVSSCELFACMLIPSQIYHQQCKLFVQTPIAYWRLLLVVFYFKTVLTDFNWLFSF